MSVPSPSNQSESAVDGSSLAHPAPFPCPPLAQSVTSISASAPASQCSSSPSCFLRSPSSAPDVSTASSGCYSASVQSQLQGSQYERNDSSTDSPALPIPLTSLRPSSSLLSALLCSCVGRCSTPRRHYVAACVALLCLLLVGAGVSIGVLYPRPPSIVAHSLRLLQLEVDLSPSTAAGATNTATTAVNVSALLSVAFTLHNPNAYSAHHYASLVSISSVPPALPLNGHLVVPAGFIASHGAEDVNSNVSVTTSITSPTQLQQWQSGGMQVAAAADTSGYVTFLFGLPVHYTVHTQCTATLTLDMRQSSVAVSGQKCSNGL